MSSSDPVHSTDPASGPDRESGWEPSSADLARQGDSTPARQTDPQVGTAYAVNVRSEAYGRDTGSETVLTFRLRRLDPSGRELPPVSVEMRGRILTGTVTDGDLVRLPAPVTGGGLQLKSVTNLTTGTAVSVRASQLPRWVGITFLVVFGVIFLGILAAIISTAMGMSGFMGGM